jgi:integrase
MPKWTVIEEKCFVQTRNNSLVLQAKYLVNGKWKRASTGCKDIDDAKDAALKKYMEVLALEGKGLTTSHVGEVVKTAKWVAHQYIKELLETKNRGTYKRSYDDYIRFMNSWVIPYFEDTPISEVDQSAMVGFDIYRENRLKRVPAKSTLNTHNAAFNGMFDLAHTRKWVKASTIPKFTIKNKGRKSKRRPGFSHQEIVELEKRMNVWAQNGDKSFTRYKRKMLIIYSMLLARCGIRTGKEIAALKWKHIDENFLNMADGKRYIRMSLPWRKTESDTYDEHVKVSQDFQPYLDSLKKLTKQTEPDDHLFCDLDGGIIKGFSQMFGLCLEHPDVDMRHTPTGINRTSYSLRHYYATERIRKEKVPFEVLARHMATSVGMLHRFYVDVETDSHASGLAPSHNMDIPRITADNFIDHIDGQTMGAEAKLKAYEAIDDLDVDEATKKIMKKALQ